MQEKADENANSGDKQIPLKAMEGPHAWNPNTWNIKAT